MVTSSSARAQEHWISGYYPGWVQEKFPPANIRMEGMTHLMHFAATVQADGTLTLDDFMLSQAHIAATVQRAHAAGKKVLIVLGGANTREGFRGATSDDHRAVLIANIINLVKEHHYDGVDLDWEPLLAEDNAQYKLFVVELHAALKAHDEDALLTAATGPDPLSNPQIGKLFAELQPYFDQINLMTYVLSGPWPGWISWHGSALHNGGEAFPGGRPLPSIELNLANFVEAGVAPAKLGIGIGFHGDIWQGGEGTPAGGVTAPRQAWTTPPTVTNDVAYAQIMAEHHRPERVRFDEVAKAPYLSIDEPGSANDRFISYTDPAGVSARLSFMKARGYGGAIIWHLGQDQLPDGAQPLVEAVVVFRSDD